jgi:hypothetical protein
MLNPNTGFQIQKGSVEVKKLLNDHWIIDNGILVPPQDIRHLYVKKNDYLLNNKWHSRNKTKTINPDTGKYISYRTALNKDFIIQHDNDKVSLIPKDKSNYGKTMQSWLKKDTKAYIQAEEDGLFETKKVYLPNLDQDGKSVMVTVDSPQFTQMINDGFTYDEKKNLLKYPKYETVVEVTFPVSSEDVNGLLQSNNITLIVDGERINIPINTLRKTVEYINQVFFYKYHTGELRSISGGQHVKFGIAFQGLKNCTIVALEKHCDKHKYDLKNKFYKLYKKYKYGVYGNDYNNIAMSLQLQIRVHLPNKEKVCFGKKTYKRAVFDCQYTSNHISEWNPENKTIDSKDKPVKWQSTNPEYVPEKLNQIQNIHGSLSNPTLIEYPEHIERLSHEIIITDDSKDYCIDYKKKQHVNTYRLFYKKIY